MSNPESSDTRCSHDLYETYDSCERRPDGSSDAAANPTCLASPESKPNRPRPGGLLSLFKGHSVRRLARSAMATPADSTPSIASPPTATPGAGAIPSGASSGARHLSSPNNPSQQAQDALDHAHRLGSRAVETVGRVPSSWAAATSTVDLLDALAAKLGDFTRLVTAIGDVHPYLKAATGVIGAIVKPILSQDDRDDKFESLLEEMRLAYDHVVRSPCAISLPKKKRGSRQMAVLKEICRESEQCALFIQNEYTRNFWTRTAKNSLNGDKVDKEMERFKASFTRLNAKWEAETRHYTQGELTLDKLSPIRHAGHASQRACLPNTRTTALREIRKWMDAPGPEPTPVVFLLGVAGSGKSSIAHTVAETGHDQATLGSFFAFDRDDASRRPERLLPTIAYHLAHWSEEYRDWLVGNLKDDSTLADSPDIMKQWKRLIVDPAMSISSSGPVLVIIDALDECPDPSDDSRKLILDCLTVHADMLPETFRILVTSRPLDEVSQAISPASVGRLDLSDFSAGEDIRLYVRSQLPPPEKGGLSDQDCDDVADAADGLFQWAATACRFLSSKLAGTTMSAKFAANVERLIHGDSGRTQRRNGPPSLDALYAAILDDTFDALDRAAMSNFLSAVALMLCAEIPLSIDALQSIYRRARSTRLSVVHGVLGSMGVVLEGATSLSSPVRPMHLSFREFLLDVSRSGPWHINGAVIAEGHRTLALGGLRIMAGDLSFNMLDIKSSRGKDFAGWSWTDLADCQRATALEYSIFHVHRHLSDMRPESDGGVNDLLVAFRDILHYKFLFWLEWLIAGGALSVGYKTLLVAEQMLTGNDLIFAQDAALFVRYFADQLHDSPVHVYLSALSFAPTDSPVRQRYIRHFPGIPTVNPIPASWSAYDAVPLAKPARHVAWSADGSYIREDREQLPSRCWDARTGTAVDVLPLGVDWRYPSSQSADGSVKVTIAFSASQWRTQLVVERNESATVLTLCASSYTSNFRADISPDGRWLVLVSDDSVDSRSVGLWDLETGQRVCRLLEVSQAIRLESATFSPDSRTVAVFERREHALKVLFVDPRTNGPWQASYINFKPQPRIGADRHEFPDADVRCQEPDIRIPEAYRYRHWQPGLRLMVGGEPLTVDFDNACYGPDWAQCYAGTIEAVESEDEHLAADDMEESTDGHSWFGSGQESEDGRGGY